MKLSLSVKISIKDFHPKNENIPFDTFICLFTYNNLNWKINLRNLSSQNSIKHKVDNLNSNIIYNIKLLDSNQNSLVGMSQLIIFFDKIKNLNINDKLTHEDKVKILIDSKTKRKIFNQIFNMGDIYLTLLTEITIIDKKLFECENQIISNKNKEEKEFMNNSLNKNNSKFDINLTPRSSKKNDISKSIKKEREAIKRVDTFSNYNDINYADYLTDESLKNSTTNSMLQKNKSLQKINKPSISKKYKKNSNTNNNLLTRHMVIKSCIEIPSPYHNKTNYNFNYKKEEKKKNILPKSNKKCKIPKKKVTILNLMEEKINSLLLKSKEDNSLELNDLSKEYKDFKNTSINFSKIQINNNKNLKKYNSRTLNKHKSTKFKETFKNNEYKNSHSNTNILEESDIIKKEKNNQIKKKININLTQRYFDRNPRLSHKSENEKEINSKRIYPKKVSLNKTGRLNTESNANKCEKKNINQNLNLAFIQTEIYNRKLSEKKINLKKNKNLKTDLNLEQLIIEKGASIKGNFNNFNIKEKSRGTFSPKLSLKFKFNENALLTNKNDLSNYKLEQEKYSYRYKEKTRLLTPKSKQKKLNSFSNNFYNEENYFVEKEEIKKKYINLIDFYSLLSKKLKKTNKNNIDISKNFEKIKEKSNYLKKQNNKLIQKYNTQESKRLNNKTIFHFEQEQLLNKILNIKIKENSAYEDIFGPEINCPEFQNKIEELIMQKKEMMLNLIKNIVKFYGNISQIYNNDINKKNMLKSLLNKYDIKEKIKIDLNYISHIHKENNFEDKIITEVDEDKENEEDEDEIKKINNSINKQINNNGHQITNENNSLENNNNVECIKIIDDNIEKGIDKKIYNENKDTPINNNDIIYDENLNNLIKKILIDQFPENYKTNKKFRHIEKNKYAFGNKIFLGFIEKNDVVLKEEINENNISIEKLTLNEFFDKFCKEEKLEKKSNFIYTKKIRQKYIKIKNEKNDKEQSLERKPKNENSTTISDNDKIQQSILSKLNEMGEMKNSMSEEKEII